MAVGRQDHLGAARLVGADLVRVRSRAWSARSTRAPARSGRSTPASRSTTRSRSTRPAACTSSPTTRCTASTPAPGGAPAVTWREAYAEHRRAQARPDRARLGHHADADGPRLRRDHRQRRPDGRGRLQAREDGHRRAAGLRAAGVRAGRGRHRQLADRRRPLDGRREQLRLQRPDRDRAGRDDHARASSASTSRHGGRLPDGLAQRRERAVGGAEAVARDRARLHVHEARRPERQRRLVLHGDRLPHGRRPSTSGSPAPGSASTTTTRRSRSAPTAPPTWARSAGSCCCAIAA